MTNPRQRKKLKRPKLQKRKKVSKNNIWTSIGYSPVSSNWEKKQTLIQNYRRLGLVARPNQKTGGSETNDSDISFFSETNLSKLQPNEARIERDDKGNIIGIIYGKQREFDDESDDNVMQIEEKVPKTDVIRELKKRAARYVKVDKKLSKNETYFLKRLIDRYGDNVEAMAKDIKLNIMQETVGTLQRKINKLKKEQN